MLTRIVKMHFRTDEVDTFLDHFDANKNQIRHFPGCKGLTLYRDINFPNVFFTYSFWEDEKSLENYRNSELFDRVWTYTRALFEDKPQAWSLSEFKKVD
jgi:quinol monooxygenase YgiN